MSVLTLTVVDKTVSILMLFSFTKHSPADEFFLNFIANLNVTSCARWCVTQTIWCLIPKAIQQNTFQVTVLTTASKASW